jgi:pimeloyl-ACP methyl ester carboxylesterase
MRSPLTLHYEEAGPRDAPPVIFLHGITGSRRYWNRAVRRLSRSFRLILPDLIGFGLSPKPHVEYTMDVYRRSVRALVEEIGLEHREILFVAHSLGSLIALNYAAAHPHVGRMVLLSLPRYTDTATAHRLFWRGSPHYRRLLNEHSLSETVAQMKRSGLELTLRYLFRFPWQVLVDAHKFSFKSLTSTLEHCLLNYRVDAILPAVPPVPTLLVHGEQDSVAPLDHVRRLPESFPFMRVHPISRTGHHVFLTHTRLCLDLIQSFLQDGVGGELRRGTGVLLDRRPILPAE